MLPFVLIWPGTERHAAESEAANMPSPFRNRACSGRQTNPYDYALRRTPNTARRPSLAGSTAYLNDEPPRFRLIGAPHVPSAIATIHSPRDLGNTTATFIQYTDSAVGVRRPQPLLSFPWQAVESVIGMSGRVHREYRR